MKVAASDFTNVEANNGRESDRGIVQATFEIVSSHDDAKQIGEVLTEELKLNYNAAGIYFASR